MRRRRATKVRTTETVYRDFTIKVSRDGGLLNYYCHHVTEPILLADSFSVCEDTIPFYVRSMKERVDRYLETGIVERYYDQ